MNNDNISDNDFTISRMAFLNAKNPDTIKKEDYVMDDGTPIINTTSSVMGGGNEIDKKAEYLVDNLFMGRQKGVSKAKELMKDEDVKEFNKVLAKITFAKEGMDINVEEIFRNPENVFNSIVKYFETCINKNIMPTIATMCAFIGCTKEELFKYAGNTNCPSYKVLSKGIMLCHSFVEMGAINGVVDSKVFSFLSKNYYGLKDDSNINIKAGISNDSTVNNVETARAIREQIMEENDKLVIDMEED